MQKAHRLKTIKAGLGILTMLVAKIARIEKSVLAVLLCFCVAGNVWSESLTVSEEGVTTADTTLPVNQKMLQLDAEILLLKAELARQNGEHHLVKALLQQIPLEILKPEDQQRVEALQKYWQQKSAVEHIGSDGKTFPSQQERIFQVDLQQPLAILPLTGPYGSLGQALLEGLQSQLDSSLQVVDSALFEKPAQLWSLVSLYQPSMVFGPLRPDWSLALSQLNTTIPMLTFNSQTQLQSNVRSFAPNKQDRLQFLNFFLQLQEVERLGVLYRPIEGEQSRAYLPLWQQLNQQFLPPFKVQQAQAITAGVDQAFGQLVNADLSQKRARWLQHTLGKHLHYQARARQDLQAIVMFAPLDQGLQGRPLMTYYHLDQNSFVWLPDPLPAQEELQKSLPVWQQTYGVFPAYFQLPPLTEPLKSLSTSENNLQNSTVGIFYALGEATIKVLTALHTNSDHPLPQLFLTRLGKVWVDQAMQFHLIPKIVWLDEGLVEPFAMDSLWPYLMKQPVTTESGDDE